MTAAPTFSLPACGACSNLRFPDRPKWKLAHHTTAKQGKPAYFFLGCRHAAAVADPRKLHTDPAEWAAIEAAWSEATERLFAERTARYSDVSREKFRRELAGTAFLPGATESLSFSPDVPASTATKTEIHHG